MDIVSHFFFFDKVPRGAQKCLYGTVKYSSAFAGARLHPNGGNTPAPLLCKEQHRFEIRGFRLTYGTCVATRELKNNFTVQQRP